MRAPARPERAAAPANRGATLHPASWAAPWAVAAGAAWVLAVAAIDLMTGPDLILLAVTLLGGFVAALSAQPRSTAGVALLAAVTALVLGVPGDFFLDTDHIVRVGLVSSSGAMAVYLAWLQRERQAATGRLARVAEIAQSVMLRPPPAELASIGLAATYRSASEESLIGGDLYETAYTPAGVRLIIGDVRGKGLDGIRLAATVLAAFREAVWDRDLAGLARTLDERVAREAGDEDFVTVLLAELPAHGEVRLVNCGHHAPLRVGAAGADLLEPEVPTVPLGLGPEPRVERYPMTVGDRLLLSTDGLLEARDAQGEFFPLLEHLDVLSRPDLQDAVDGLVDRALAHVPGPLRDDLAVLLAERRG